MILLCIQILSEKKCQILAKELHILGHIVDDDGIKMDPSKVDTVLNWKIPTNRELLSGFLGSVGYLADNIDRVRVPMGVLHTLTGATVPWKSLERTPPSPPGLFKGRLNDKRGNGRQQYWDRRRRQSR